MDFVRQLEQWMVETEDGMLPVFRQRDDADAREAYVAAQEKEAEARRAGGKGKAKQATTAAVTGAKNSAAPTRQPDCPLVARFHRSWKASDGTH